MKPALYRHDGSGLRCLLCDKVTHIGVLILWPGEAKRERWCCSGCVRELGACLHGRAPMIGALAKAGG